jgi:hypothetical protein
MITDTKPTGVSTSDISTFSPPKIKEEPKEGPRVKYQPKPEPMKKEE